MGSYRLTRIEALLQKEIGTLILNDINDRRVKKITLTSVKISPDLRHAKIFFTVLNSDDIKPAEIALKKTAHYFKKHIAKDLDLRVVPELMFIYDKDLVKAEKLMNLISHLNHG